MVMTLAALEKAALDLPADQRVRLANSLVASLPPHREALSFEELEKRADEALSGSVEMFSAEEVHRGALKLIEEIAKSRGESYPRHDQRG